jgi:hypothetical protein
MSLVKLIYKTFARIPSNLDRDELRITQNGLLTAVSRNDNVPKFVISPDLRQRRNKDRNLDVPVMKKETSQFLTFVLVPLVKSIGIGLVRVVWKTVVADI